MESDSSLTDPIARYQHALALHSAGRLREAAALYNAMLDEFPGNPLLIAGLGTIALQQGDLPRGVSQLEASLRIEPNQPMALTNLGLALRNLKRPMDALSCLDSAIALAPDSPDAHNYRGIVMHDLGRLEEALASYDKAVALKPDFATAYNNRGAVLQQMNRLDDARHSLDRALALNPIAADIHNNRGRVLRDLGRLDDAMESWDAAITLDPGYAPAILNKAMLLLLTGKFDEGWRLYEWRWKDPDATAPRTFSQPSWLGASPIAGKTLLIDTEQGLGDIIQFSRYIPMVEALGAKVILEVFAPLVPLISSLKSSCTVVATGQPLPAFDMHCPIMSLPLAFRTTAASIPASVPYLYANAYLQNTWRQRLGPKTKPRIGLAWSGRPTHRNDHNRSIPLALLTPLLELGVEFHALQKEFSTNDAAIIARYPQLQCHAEELNDFADTAALVREMDLVISVDTSVAHVAGALGAPLWLLLPFIPDFRWLLDRQDSPWYPSARLFRQPAPNDWAAVIKEIILNAGSIDWGNLDGPASV